MIRVSAEFRRGDWHIRVRGRDPMSGESVDTRERIADDVFANARASRFGSRAADVALRYAAAEEQRMNDPAKIRHRAALLRDRMNLQRIWQLYQRKNPGQVQAETMRRSAKMARALLKCRCRAVDNVTCLAHHDDPRHIDIGAAEEFRNDRMKECAVCSLREGDHPKVEGRHSWRGVSPRSTFNELGLLKQLLTFARDHERETGIDTIALQRLPTISGKRGTRDKLTPAAEEFFRIFDACSELGDDGDRYRRIIGFAYSVGLRKHPLAHFRMEWFDPKTRHILVPSEFMKGRGDHHEDLNVPISRWAASFLHGLPATGYAWPNPATGLPQVDFFRVESRLTEMARLPRKFSLHRLRAGFNTLLISHRCTKHRTEVPFYTRELLMGHAIPPQIATYADFSQVLVEAVAVVDCAFDAHEKQSGVVRIDGRRRRA